MERLKDKVREVTLEIRKINNLRDSMDNIIILEKVNSKIVGIAEFYKTCTASQIMKSQDQKLYHTAYKKWVKLNGGQKVRWENFVINAKEVNNRPKRHQKRNDRIFYLELEEMKIGLTKFQFTESKIPHRWKAGISKYTFEGRQYLKKKNWKEKNARGTLYSINSLEISRSRLLSNQINPRYNFEYMMNREYVFLIDKGKCRCCGETITSFDNIHCHHRKPWLPLNQVNKVENLATVCKYCHRKIHGLMPNVGTTQMMKKIDKFKAELSKKDTKDNPVGV